MDMDLYRLAAVDNCSVHMWKQNHILYSSHLTKREKVEFTI